LTVPSALSSERYRKMIDRKTAILITNEMEAAIAPVLAKYGLDRDRTATAYGDIYKVTFTAHLAGEDPAVKNYGLYADAYGLPADSLGTVITSRGQKYVVTGLNPRAKTMPILCKGEDGRTYKFPIASLKRVLGLPVNPWDER